MGLHVESLTPPSVPGHSISGVLIDSVLGNTHRCQRPDQDGSNLSVERPWTNVQRQKYGKGQGPRGTVRGPGYTSQGFDYPRDHTSNRGHGRGPPAGSPKSSAGQVSAGQVSDGSYQNQFRGPPPPGYMRIPQCSAGQATAGQVSAGPSQQHIAGATDQYFLPMTAQQSLLGALEQQLQQLVSRAILQALSPGGTPPNWGTGGANPAPSS